jgi:hypothetical protein
LENRAVRMRNSSSAAKSSRAPRRAKLSLLSFWWLVGSPWRAAF